MSARAILDFIKNNPGTTSRKVAERFGLNPQGVSSPLLRLTRQGRLKREIIGQTVTGVPIYGYTFVQYDSIRQEANIAPQATKRLKTASVGDLPSIEALIGQVASSLTDMIVLQVRNQLAVELSRVLPDANAIVLPPPVEPVVEYREAPVVHRQEKQPAKTRLKKVLVVGMLPAQAGSIVSEFCDALDITFWHDQSGNGLGELSAQAKAADAVFVHINHCSHKAQAVIKKQSQEMKLIGGGVGAMKDALHLYFANA